VDILKGILVGLCIVIVSLSALAVVSTFGFLFIKSTLTALRSIAPLSWSPVEGVISSSIIYEERGTIEDSETGKTRDYTHHHPLIYYSYEFGFRQYKSDRVSLADESLFAPTGKKDAEKTVSKYQHGMSVKVYCNPRKPQQSVLEPGLKRRIIASFLLSLLLFSFIVGFIFLIIYDVMTSPP
jgi:hypothetical protein